MAIQASILDYCLPGYFQGCSPDWGELLAVPVDNETTAEEFREGLEAEWYGTAGSELSDDWDEDEVSTELDRLVDEWSSYGDLFPQAGPRDSDSESSFCYVLVSNNE